MKHIPMEMDIPNEPNGWGEWSKHVLLTLETQNEDIKKLEQEFNKLNTNFKVFQTEMKIKAGVWGALSGMIPVVGMILWLLAKSL